ncbi:MAG: UDP-N-acetylmuramoyl-tripeptide--D-alanyl-D-alanine ligase [Opitutaceae bacterium]
MYAYTADELAHITQGVWHAQDSIPAITEFCFDARQITAGACFVALSGGARDGHDFVAQAAEGGAAAAIVECPLDVAIPQCVVGDSLVALGSVGAASRARFNQPVVGITGSCGKTSTKEMLRILLGEERTHATAGNWNNRIGVPMTLLDLDAQCHDFAVVEAGINQPDEMQLLGEMIRADLTIVTNVGPAHLELLKTVENVAAEKARLAEASVANAPAIFPSALLQYPSFQQLAKRAIVLHLEGELAPTTQVAQFVTCQLQAKSSGYQVTLADAGVSLSYQVSTSSRGIATNAALAILAARSLGIDEADIQTRMRQWQPTANRGRILAHCEQWFYVDCYNANPVSMSDALDAFIAAADQGQPRAYIIGAMNELGETAEEAHHSIGKQLDLRPGDFAYFIGPDSLVEAYRAGALHAGNDSTQLIISQSIENVKSDIAEFRGTLFLKGSRSYQLEKLLPQQIRNS